MPIHTRTWLGRLTVQCPGWYFWYAPDPNDAGVSCWHAAPAPAKQRLADPWRQPGRVDAADPKRLRALCQRRYGWDDQCATCGDLVRLCGHRPRRSHTPAEPT
jgi:hypothetical protein